MIVLTDLSDDEDDDPDFVLVSENENEPESIPAKQLRDATIRNSHEAYEKHIVE
ncbi:hypothetical protein NX059_012457 [Plenodomus lindquistii]|nr:hypothetical protein NX059_012457 [Plenodomus lindquistii]